MNKTSMIYRCSNTACEAKGIDLPETKARQFDFKCRFCGGALVAVPDTENGADLQEWVSVLPTVIAVPLQNYIEENHPAIRLWSLCDTAELALRLLVFIGIAEHEGKIPGKLKEELSERIERPSLGEWLAMARAVAANLPKEALCPELRETISVLNRLLGSSQSKPEEGLLGLRNRLAHGGGLVRKAADQLLFAWAPRIPELIAPLAWLREISLIGRDGKGILRHLVGQASSGREISESVFIRLPPKEERDALWIVRGERILKLWPLCRYATVLDEDPVSMPQIYMRRGEVAIQLTPVGGDGPIAEVSGHALASFLRMFECVRRELSNFSVQNFDNEVRKEARRRVGREEELTTLRQTISDHSARLIWVHGTAGSGKSCLISSLASELIDHPPQGTRFLIYRFRSGDQRCSRDIFFQFAIERLATWEGIERTEKELSETARPFDQLADILKRIRLDHRVFFILDGLDELAETDPTFAKETPIKLSSEHVAFLCAGRPEPGLMEIFKQAKALEPFPDGLGPWNERDIYAFLLDKLPSIRKRLLKRDREQGDQIVNPFIERLARLSDGLPLYVNHILGDMEKGIIVPEAEGQLPKGLSAYYEELIRRLGVSDLQAIMTPLAATLALARLPLSLEELTALLKRRRLLADENRLLIEKALRGIASMVRRSAGSDGRDGITLYHHSLRQHLLTSASIKNNIDLARKDLAEAALAPVGDAVERYLYQAGIRHLLDDGRRNDADRLMTSLDFIMDRFKALGGGKEAVQGWYEDWDRLLAERPLQGEMSVWWNFAESNRHLLLRGDPEWPAWKILLQLAAEHADDSPVTKAAEAYLASGKCDWFWLKRVNRPKQYETSPCIAVLEGHKAMIYGGIELDNERILSWSADKTLCLWNSTTGMLIAVLKGHKSWVWGACQLSDDRIISWSTDGTLRIWDSNTGAQLATLIGHEKAIVGATVLADGHILSWSFDATLRLWDGIKGKHIATLQGHTNWVRGACKLSNGKLVSWSEDGTLRCWDGMTGKLINILEGHTSWVHGACELANGRILSWAQDKTLRLWNESTGKVIAILEGHKQFVSGAKELPDGRILSWSGDNMLHIWEGKTGKQIVTLEGHSSSVFGAQILSDGHILSWSADEVYIWDGTTGQSILVVKGCNSYAYGTNLLPTGHILTCDWDGPLRIWNQTTGEPVATFAGHTGKVFGTKILSNGHILSWSEDNTLRLWDSSVVGHHAIHEGHTSRINGVRILSDSHILSWSNDLSMCIWDSTNGKPVAIMDDYKELVSDVIIMSDGRVLSWAFDCSILRMWDAMTGKLLFTLDGHSYPISGAKILSNNRILSWSVDGSLRIWNDNTGRLLAISEGHTSVVGGVIELPDGRILSWSNDKTLRLWDGNTGKILAILEGHTKRITGAIVLADGHILSWAEDCILRLWDGDTGKHIVLLEGHTLSVLGAMVLSDGRILSWARDKTLRLWDGITGTTLSLLKGHTDAVFGARILINGNILSWSFDGSLRVWDNATGKPLGIFKGQTDVVFGSIVYIDGHRFPRVIDGAVSAWNERDGEILYPHIRSAYQKVPELFRSYFTATDMPNCEGWFANQSFLFTPSLGLIAWNASGEWNPTVIHPTGIFALIGGRNLVITHLMHGAHRISLKEAAALLIREKIKG